VIPFQVDAATDCASVTEIPQAECEALVALSNSTDGPNWWPNGGWNKTSTPCNWHGVVCGDGHVTALDLSRNQLSGTIPSELGNLSHLTALNLDLNSLSGSIPSELGNLSHLTALSLSLNSLSGSIPSELGNLSYLEWLFLSENQLSGSIPSELGNLSHLKWLNLKSNQLSGSIPSELGNLSHLRMLNLSFNQLSGPIPISLMTLLLYRLLLNNNCLTPPSNPKLIAFFDDMDSGWATTQTNCSTPPTGDAATDCASVTQIPQAECEALVALYNSTDGPYWLGNTLGWNETNTPCSWIGVTCGDGHVTRLRLNSNELSGSIPRELGNLSNLTWLRLSSNQLSGSIPRELGNLSNLTRLDLHVNRLTGEIPSELGKLSNLEVLDLYFNQLSGFIPSELGDLSNLKALDLSSNQLSGSIPSELGNLSQLTSLRLHGNQLCGNIPLSLMNLKDDQLLLTSCSKLVAAATDCAAVSEIPATECEALVAFYNSTNGANWLKSTGWNVTNTPCGWYGVECGGGHLIKHLTVLSLSSNQLSGSIPRELGNLSHLTELWLYSNQLSGEIPSELGNLSHLTELWLFKNQLSGTIPSELGNLSNLTELDLDFNQLSGSIPSELGNLSNLTELDLSSNQQSGSIPSELGNLSNLTELDLSFNELSGSIPISLMTLPLRKLGLNNNNCLIIPDDPELIAFLDEKDSKWATIQINCPTDCASVTEIPQVECEALVALYNSTDGPNWSVYAGWNKTNTPCSWYGVTCSDGHVTKLYLHSNQLSGSIPRELGNLNNLTVLYLFSNQLSGSIPSELGNLSNLEWLSLSENQLSGSIPIWLMTLPLDYLKLNNNCLTIPEKPERIAFLDEKDSKWATTQTNCPTAPTGVLQSSPPITQSEKKPKP